MMDIQILEMIDGAKRARGLTVIIDVFRAFSLECCLVNQGCRQILPVGEMEKALALKKEHPDWVLFGERGGARVEGCDFGNSPSQIKNIDFSGKTVIHTTSAGTQGIVNAAGADEIITGCLLNASAVPAYIRKKDPQTVSLVGMGKAGIASAKEDVLCAEYIRSLLIGEPMDIESRLKRLRTDGGEHFFNLQTQEIYPEEDFYICTRTNVFPFVIRCMEDGWNRPKMIG